MLIHSYQEWRGSGVHPPKGWLVWQGNGLGFYAVRVLGEGFVPKSGQTQGPYYSNYVRIRRCHSWFDTPERAKQGALATPAQNMEWQNLKEWSYTGYKSVEWFPDACPERERRPS